MLVDIINYMKNEQENILKSLFNRSVKWGLLNILQIVVCIIVGNYIYSNNVFPPIMTNVIVVIIAIICLSLMWYLSGKKAKLLASTDKKFSEIEKIKINSK